MRLLPRRFNVAPNAVGFLFHRNRLVQELKPGIYYYLDPLSLKSLYVIPTTVNWFNVENQEVLSKDNVAFRFSYSIAFSVAEPAKYIERVALDAQLPALLYQANQIIHLHSQTAIRTRFAQHDSNEINDKRAELFKGTEEAVQKEIAGIGLRIEQLILRDITFPKRIQDLFALELESRIRARADLENARTQVAAARALKNASEITKNDPALQHLQFLETITKIAAHGKHTFVIGEAQVGIGK